MDEFIKKLASLITEDPDVPVGDYAERAGRFHGEPHFTGPDSNIEREVIEGVEEVFWNWADSGVWEVMDGGGRKHPVVPNEGDKTLIVTMGDGTPLITYKVNISVVPVDEKPVEEGY